MSDGIGLRAGIEARIGVQNPELPVEPSELPPQNPASVNGGENGGVYFELNLQSGRGRERQEDLLTTFSFESPTEPTFYKGDSSHRNDYGVDFGGENFPNNLPDRRDLPLDGFVDAVENNRDFIEFDNQPREFRRDVRRFSESKNVEIAGEDFLNSFDNTIETLERKKDEPKIFDSEDKVNFFGQPKDFDEQFERLKDESKVIELRKETVKIFDENGRHAAKTSDVKVETDESPDIFRYEKLVAEMNTKKLSPDEFAETLPPKEKEVFKVRYQLDVTFGTEISAKNNSTLQQTGQFRVGEIVVENNIQTAALPEEIHTFSLENMPLPTSRENVAPVGANTFADSDLKTIESTDLKLQDKSSQVAVGGNANPILTDSGTARIVNHNAASETSSNIASVARRDGGAALGGALISGAFASIENYKNTESGFVGGSNSVGNADVDGRSVFSAGATGVMMSAAIGSVIPKADATVGGVLGFIASVVVGVEAEQGLRWLGGDRPTTVALFDAAGSTDERSFAPNLNLKMRFA